MAGLGSRFAKAGFDLPKPLIKVNGQPMFLKALSSIESIKAKRDYFFVIRQEHVDTQKLNKLIKQALPGANIITIPEMTRGAAETALAAKSELDPQAGLIVMDCDLWFSSESYNKMVEDSLNGKSDIDGGLLTFTATNPRYSFAQIGPNDMVVKTAEKVAISNHAITGAFFFAKAQDFFDSAAELLKRPIDEKTPEYYLSLLYNILIDDGKKIQAAYVDEYASFGTPQELAAYNSR